jgi:hypothetical protein
MILGAKFGIWKYFYQYFIMFQEKVVSLHRRSNRRSRDIGVRGWDGRT